MAWLRRALAWLHMARQDYPGVSRHIEIGLPWAGRIESETLRAESEAQLLTLSGMVSMLVSRLDEARGTLKAVLSRGDAQSALQCSSESPALHQALQKPLFADVHACSCGARHGWTLRLAGHT